MNNSEEPKPIKNLVESVLTVMQAPQTQKQSVNTTDWANYLQFSLEGDTRTTAELSRMVNETALFIRDVKNGGPTRWLSFLGKSGTGKTYLARKIWNWYRGSEFFRASIDRTIDEIRYPGSFIHWPKLAGQLLGNEGYGVLEDLQIQKLVVIDEIGADRDPNGHVRDCLSRLLSARVGQWTIITSNKSLGDIQRDIDTRVSSRIIRDENRFIDVDVADYALRKPNP